MSKKKDSLTREQKIYLAMKAMGCNEAQAQTWLDTENIGLRTTKEDQTGIKPTEVKDEILKDYLNRIELRERVLDVYVVDGE